MCNIHIVKNVTNFKIRNVKKTVKRNSGIFGNNKREFILLKKKNRRNITS